MLKLNKVTKHEHCSIGVIELQQGPHTGELVCIDTNCTHPSKHIKWIGLNEGVMVESAVATISKENK